MNEIDILLLFVAFVQNLEKQWLFHYYLLKSLPDKGLQLQLQRKLFKYMIVKIKRKKKAGR